VVLTAGTFLRGVIHLGLDTRVPAGRAGDAPAVELAQVIEQLGIMVQRFKTGTPPRIDGRSVDFAKLARQDGDVSPYWFSAYERMPQPKQLPCWLTWTTPQFHDIITSHLTQSALYGGAIASRGPRYCPSIEDKIVKFPSAPRHQVFLEPEGLDTSEMYVNGLSTSLPPDVQLAFLMMVPGLEHVRMTRPGYAIEYDYFPPTQLKPTLELKALPGLFLAGQVNGTTGYEEAAGQGIVAGLNAAASALEREPIGLGRDLAYIGVLVDDLVSRGVDEPYRLFTSRSEYRLLLRQDNALRRLLPLAERLDLLEDQERLVAEGRLQAEDSVLEQASRATLDAERANVILRMVGSTEISETTKVAELARRPRVCLTSLLEAAGIEVDEARGHWAEVELKYAGYLKQEREGVRRLSTMEEFPLPADLPYESLHALSFEAREKLNRARPLSLGQAARISGVAPSDLHNLVAEILRRGGRAQGVSRETS
jgi:tRNA uridine 5-carboxymethylaminomethyl modification enzyme